ncbi:MAG: response regulator [Spirochaetia bacterium]|nr:response regulator [Spirochaetia bacterium]
MNQKTIMVIDDSTTSRMIMTGILQNFNSDFKFIEAEDAKTALELSEKNAVDFFIVDINMPGMSGLDLIVLLKGKYPESKIAIVTSNLGKQIQESARLNDSKCFYKPVTEDLVRDLIGYLYE